MRRLLSLLATLFLALAALSQTPREELRRNLRLSGSNFLAYPGPQQQRLTPAPRGKKPCYISHYGRHGSRYQNKTLDYDYAYDVLLKADAAGALSALGRDVLERLRTIRSEAQGRLGDLTDLGAGQHRDIARRMVNRFPEVFDGSAPVDARSTSTPRCIVSMSYALQQLLILRPALAIHQDASEHDHYYMRSVTKPVDNEEAKKAFDAYCRKHANHQRMVAQLFADTAYLRRFVNSERLCYYIFREASGMQNSDICQRLTLYDLFTDDELYDAWAKENATWFLGYAFSDLNGGRVPFSQAPLLRNIIEQADEALARQRPGCTLRFGHETILLPLVCLMDINGFGQKINDLDQLERKGWVSYRVFPMAANVQLVFYRSSPADDDVLVKVLLNENEATLPVKTDAAPYYHWADVRSYYLQLLGDQPQPQQP